MNNIRNKLRLGLVRGIGYSCWSTTDRPSCLSPQPSIFITRSDDPDYSVNLNNFPTALGGEANKL